jgi:hypothetical protein
MRQQCRQEHRASEHEPLQRIKVLWAADIALAGRPKMNRRGVLHFLGLAGRRRGPPVPLSLMVVPSLF